MNYWTLIIIQTLGTCSILTSVQKVNLDFVNFDPETDSCVLVMRLHVFPELISPEYMPNLKIISVGSFPLLHLIAAILFNPHPIELQILNWYSNSWLKHQATTWKSPYWVHVLKCRQDLKLDLIDFTLPTVQLWICWISSYFIFKAFFSENLKIVFSNIHYFMLLDVITKSSRVSESARFEAFQNY